MGPLRHHGIVVQGRQQAEVLGVRHLVYQLLQPLYNAFHLHVLLAGHP